MLPGDLKRGFVPAYHYRVIEAGGSDAGHINFRLGDSPRVLLFAGHIGFEIHPPFRGHGYAFQACQAIAPLVRLVYNAATITCDPDNHASRRTIERLGARFLNEIAVPPNDPQYLRGSRRKRRYEWRP